MSDKTTPVFKETKLGVLSIQEIEQIIFDNLILTQSFIFRNYKELPFDINTLLLFHERLCGNLFENAGALRKHNVQIWSFEPIGYHEVPIEMKKLNGDLEHWTQLQRSEIDKKRFIAEIMRRILRIHPFFDYNARVTRLFGELFFLQHTLPISTFRGTSRGDFSQAMKKATFEKDFSLLYTLLE